METSINLIGCDVIHTSWGTGIIVGQSPTMIEVKFASSETRRFSLDSPDTFRRFIEICDPEIQNSLLLREVCNLPSVEYDGVKWWRKAEKHWINIDLFRVEDRSLIAKLEKLYKNEKWLPFFEAAQKLPISELLSRIKQLRSCISSAQDHRSANKPDEYIKEKAYEGLCYAEAALRKKGISDLDVRRILPSMSSFYRNIHQPAMCYNYIYKSYKDSGLLNGQFYISLAGAFCDIGHTDNARHALDIAYSLGVSPNSYYAMAVDSRIQDMLRDRE